MCILFLILDSWSVIIDTVSFPPTPCWRHPLEEQRGMVTPRSSPRNEVRLAAEPPQVTFARTPQSATRRFHLAPHAACVHGPIQIPAQLLRSTVLDLE